ncbi:MAG: hypothetical protein NTX50_23700, partial [Candidatus Sumerlaeota bacterium]|nr:hypothetical protein [Candidatus Sumerlaeota bacterium]
MGISNTENQTAPPPHPPGGFSPRQEAWRTLNQTDPSHPDAAENLHERLDRREIPEADRRLATQLVMGVLRHRGRLDYCLSQILDKPLDRQRAPILNLLRLGVFQILYLDHAPDYAIAHETVEAIRQSEMKDAAGLINGVLRACLRRRDELAAPPGAGDPDRDFGALHSCPEWIRAALDDVLPEKGMRAWWMQAQEIPALHLRVNTLKTDKESLIAELRAAGFDPQLTPVPDVLAVSGTQRPDQLPCFEQGRAAIQDAAAALVGHLVAPRAGERIVDLCSAPGGKTAHLAAL